jgi:hypothetical protein
MPATNFHEYAQTITDTLDTAVDGDGKQAHAKRCGSLPRARYFKLWIKFQECATVRR